MRGAIETLREQWEAFGRRDPLWANLTAPGLDHGQWDTEEFLATGREEVGRRLESLEQLGIELGRGRALDFGCGAGRLTQALAERFERVDGVDIAESMIEHARRINRQGDRCRFHVNAERDLRKFESGSFDLVLSLLVLQHMEPRYALGYIREFVRLLRPGGVALFQVPARLVEPVRAPLPAAAWRAEVSVDDPPARLPAAAPYELRVRVRNTSAETWPAGAKLAVGAHWRGLDGSFVKINDGRTPLGRDVDPGDELVLPLTIVPPNATGVRTLEVDVVQERVAWFRERGLDPLRLAVEVEPADRNGGVREELGFEPWIEMHCVSREEVTATVEAAAGEVLHALADDSAGDAFESYLYVVRPSEVARVRAALARVTRAVAAVPDREDMLPRLYSTRTGIARRLELWVKRRAARATRWFTIEQVAHDRAVARALAEVEAVLLVQDAELRALREELERRRDGRD